MQRAVVVLALVLFVALPLASSRPVRKPYGQLRYGNGIAPHEVAYLEARTPVVRECIRRLTDVNATNVPRIAFAGSGGGNRALLSTLGFTMGAEENDLLDCASYISGVSGSTWMISSWILSGKTPSEYMLDIEPALSIGPFKLTNETWSELFDDLKTRAALGEQIGVVDLYGSAIGNHLLTYVTGKNSHFYLSSLRQRVESGRVPFPIFCSVDVHENTPVTDFRVWFEFNPYEVGSAADQMWVPTELLGSEFQDGKTVRVVPETPLSSFMGTWGSAFEVTMKYIYEHYIANTWYLRWLKPFFDGHRLFKPKTFRNYMKGIPIDNLPQDDNLFFVDAGIDFNLPLPPLMTIPERNIDIYVIFDASAVLEGGPELRGAEEFARKNNIPFPVIDYTDIDTKPLSIFSDPNNSTIPTVVYMPLFDPDSPTPPVVSRFSSGKFEYTTAELEYVTGVGRKNVAAARSALIDVIRAKLAQLNPSTL